MKVIVQRSLKSQVVVDNNLVGSIDRGLVLLVGFKSDDTIDDVDYIVKKIVNLRIFDDENHIMNKSIIDVGGSILSVSQFTLYANTKKGNRPSYFNAMSGDNALKLYNIFNDKLRKYIDVQTGSFGNDMCVTITNDGPVTIILESRD